jgi:hypothetical protein
MGFDASNEGERLRRHAAGCQRAMHRAIDTIIKMRKNLETAEIDTSEIVGEEPESPLVEEQLETPPVIMAATNFEGKTLECRSKATEADDHPQVQTISMVEDQQSEAHPAQSEAHPAMNPESHTTDHDEPRSDEIASTAVMRDDSRLGLSRPKDASEQRDSAIATTEIPTFTSLKNPATIGELRIATNALNSRAQSDGKSAKPCGRRPNQRDTAPTMTPAPSTSESSSSSVWTGRRWTLADTRIMKRSSTSR